MYIQPTELQTALAALAAPKRFELLVLMLAGEDRSVSQLAMAVGLSQSCTTRHLQALARAGLVKGARDGKRVVFRVAPRDAGARAVLASIAGGANGGAGALDGGSLDGGAVREPVRPRRVRSGHDSRARRKLLETAVRIESATEFEPLMADDGPVEPRDLRPDRESDRTSEPEAAPAWRRSDLEDFLL
jgi:DNA-binding transcriptional ArsR family regulator